MAFEDAADGGSGGIPASRGRGGVPATDRPPARPLPGRGEEGGLPVAPAVFDRTTGGGSVLAVAFQEENRVDRCPTRAARRCRRLRDLAHEG